MSAAHYWPTMTAAFFSAGICATLTGSTSDGRRADAEDWLDFADYALGIHPAAREDATRVHRLGIFQL